MKITDRQLRLISGLTMLTGAIVSIIFKSAGKYIGIGIIIVGMILLAPWVKDEKK
jgi:uncharacterized protein YjeT (DUF2065 family)